MCAQRGEFAELRRIIGDFAVLGPLCGRERNSSLAAEGRWPVGAADGAEAGDRLIGVAEEASTF